MSFCRTVNERPVGMACRHLVVIDGIIARMDCFEESSPDSTMLPRLCQPRPFFWTHLFSFSLPSHASISAGALRAVQGCHNSPEPTRRTTPGEDGVLRVYNRCIGVSSERRRRRNTDVITDWSRTQRAHVHRLVRLAKRSRELQMSLGPANRQAIPCAAAVGPVPSHSA